MSVFVGQACNRTNAHTQVPPRTFEPADVAVLIRAYVRASPRALSGVLEEEEGGGSEGGSSSSSELLRRLYWEMRQVS